MLVTMRIPSHKRGWICGDHVKAALRRVIWDILALDILMWRP